MCIHCKCMGNMSWALWQACTRKTSEGWGPPSLVQHLVLHHTCTCTCSLFFAPGTGAYTSLAWLSQPGHRYSTGAKITHVSSITPTPQNTPYRLVELLVKLCLGPAGVTLVAGGRLESPARQSRMKTFPPSSTAFSRLCHDCFVTTDSNIPQHPIWASTWNLVGNAGRYLAHTRPCNVCTIKVCPSLPPCRLAGTRWAA